MEISPQELKELVSLFSQNKPLNLETLSKIGKQAERPRENNSNYKATIYTSYNLVLECIRKQAGQNDFSESDAIKIAGPILGYKDKMIIRALTYAVNQRILARRRAHVYYFIGEIQPAEQVIPTIPQADEIKSNKYQPDQNALLDIVCEDSTAIQRLFKLIAKTRRYLTLVINQTSGISTRFLNEDQVILSDLQISKESFSVYHCKTNLKLTLDITELLRVSSVEKGLHLHLADNQEQRYEVNGHRLKYEECIKSETEIMPTLPQPIISKDHHAIQISRKIIYDILENVRLISSRVSITFRNDGILFAPISDNPEYTKELLAGDSGLNILVKPAESRKAVFDVFRLIDMIRSSHGGRMPNEILTLRLNNEDLLSVGFNEQDDKARLLYYLPAIKQNNNNNEKPVPATTIENGNTAIVPITPN